MQPGVRRIAAAVSAAATLHRSRRRLRPVAWAAVKRWPAVGDLQRLQKGGADGVGIVHQRRGLTEVEHVLAGHPGQRQVHHRHLRGRKRDLGASLPVLRHVQGVGQHPRRVVVRADCDGGFSRSPCGTVKAVVRVTGDGRTGALDSAGPGTAVDVVAACWRRCRPA